MIALLFALLTAMILTFRDRARLACVVFAVAVVLGVYWLDFHATSTLAIQL